LLLAKGLNLSFEIDSIHAKSYAGIATGGALSWIQSAILAVERRI
jgi:hypothetical protein